MEAKGSFNGVLAIIRRSAVGTPLPLASIAQKNIRITFIYFNRDYHDPFCKQNKSRSIHHLKDFKQAFLIHPQHQVFTL